MGRAIVWILAVLAVIRLWLMPIGNSFWLDETVIVWAIRGNVAHILQAGLRTPQSTAFCLIERMVSLAAGFSEPALRLIPIAAGTTTLYVLYKIGVEFIDPAAGLTFVAIYITLQQVAIEIPNARPYSMALLAESASLLFLLRWLRDGRMKQGLFWVVCAVAAGHLHFFFFSVLPLEAAYAWWRGSSALRRQLAICCTIGLGFAALTIPQTLFLCRQAQRLAWASQPTVMDLVKALFPLYVLPVLFLAVVDRLFEKRSGWAGNGRRQATEIGGLILVLPVLGAFFLSYFTDMRVFHPRYLLPTAPGLVLFWGWMLQRIASLALRQTALIVGLASAIVVTGGVYALIPNYHQEDWRSAARNTPRTGVTLIYSGLIETQRLEWLEDPFLWGYLASPALAYRPELQPADGLLLPFNFGETEAKYLEGLIAQRIRGRDTVSVVSRQTFAGPQWISWISERLRAVGFDETRKSDYGLVHLDVFETKSVARVNHVNTEITGPGARSDQK